MTVSIDKKERWRQIANPFFSRTGTSPASIPHPTVVDPDFIKIKENAYQPEMVGVHFLNAC